MDRSLPSVDPESAAWIAMGAVAAVLFHAPLLPPGTPALDPVHRAELQEPREVKLIASDVVFAPSRIQAAPGEWIRITVKNASDVSHSVEMRLPDGLHGLDPIAPGESDSLDLIAPDRPGLYDFYCPLDDHHARGMDGFLVVRRARGG